MKHKLEDAFECIKEARMELESSLSNLGKVVRNGKIAREEFMRIVNVELNIIWKTGKEKNSDKVEWAKLRNKVDPEFQVYNGVIVGDEELEEFEKKNAESKSKTQNNVGVYDGIELDDKQKQIISFPLQHTTFTKLNVEAFETELEKCKVKAKWQKFQEMRKEEENRATEEIIINGEKKSEALDESFEKVFSSKNKILNFQNLKATDLKGNKRIIMPDLDDDIDEIRRNNVNNELKNVFLKFREDHCDKFGNQIENNLDSEQFRTIKNLREKLEKENLICYETDKTGKLVVDSVKNYSDKMMKNIANDEIITEEKVKKIENKLNEHVDFWMKMTNAGENTKQAGRVKSNLKSQEGQLPVLRGTSKDHKEAKNVDKGPDLRPIMGAYIGPNVGLANIGGLIIRRIAEETDTGFVCKSTEEMQYRFEKYNKERIEKNLGDKNIIIGSMDVEKWYPRLNPKRLGVAVKNMVIVSEIEFEGINYEAVSKYLGKFMTKEEIEDENMEEILYIKVKKTRRKRKETVNRNMNKKEMEKEKENENGKTLDTSTNGGGNTVNNKNKEKKNDDDWEAPKRNPTKKEKRNMLGKALEILVVNVMENHVYTFGNEIRIQSEGGPIGLSLTGELADAFMVEWDKEVVKRVKEVGVDLLLYERYKDDINVVAVSVERGTEIKDGKLVINEEKIKADEGKSDSQITMDIVRDVAEGVDPMITLTTDVPSNYENGYMPILDLEVKINKEENNRLDFQFFEKPTKNGRILMPDSACPARQKRTILTQECLRRLRNTKIDLGEEIQNFHLSMFMLKLKNSGHSAKYRKQILESALNAFEKMKLEDKNGTKPLYRGRSWDSENRAKKKAYEKINWYNKEGQQSKGDKIVYKTVLFVPTTKDGVLMKMLKKREEELNRFSSERIKIVEEGGTKISTLLTKNPFPVARCNGKALEMCFVCKSLGGDNPKISCRSTNVGYRLGCETCAGRGKNKIYEGETGRAAKVRGKEHWAGFKNRNPKNVLYKHKQMEHPEEDIEVSMKITRTFKDALTRQANEAIRIENRKPDELLNSKSEMNHPKIARIGVQNRN